MSFSNYKSVDPKSYKSVAPTTAGRDLAIKCTYPGVTITYLGLRHPAALAHRGYGPGSMAMGFGRSATAALWNAIYRCRSTGMESSRWFEFKKAMDGSRIRGLYRDNIPDRGRAHTVIIEYLETLKTLPENMFDALRGSTVSEARSLVPQIDKRCRLGDVVCSTGEAVVVRILDGTTCRGQVKLRV